ncbi:MAG: undecaprenyl/decaprenyl-phosphate alpha-N-acetylglucosaminyl 1-phosphate transferase [Myxococcales bacterium]|nr:undecaprenyl/decaprenyl-phosphate alpha-N-acetylglucosaminyl 1-phosphate transferase [Myxococcales bacterium]
MNTYVVAFLLSAVVSLLLTRQIRDLAIARGLVDSPADPRKVHVTPIPRLGGIAIAIGFVLPLMGLAVVDNAVAQAFWDTPSNVFGFFGGSAMMVGLGVVDDLRGLNAVQKLTVQLLAALLAWATGFRITEIANPFGDPLQFGLFSLPVTLLWIVGITNAMNLLDGLDGLAGGVAFFTALLLFMMGVNSGYLPLALIGAALSGALVGFLRYNFNPASIFMGDSGSLFLGYVLAVTGIWTSHKSTTVVSMAIPVLALGVPIADTFMAIFRRFIRGRPVFSADREHIHHRLLDLGMSQRQAVVAIYGASSALAAGAMTLVYANGPQAAMILSALGVGALVVGRQVGWLDIKALNQSWRFGRMRLYGAMGRVEAARVSAERIRAAASIDEVLAVLEDMAPALKVQELHIDLLVNGRPYSRRWLAEGGATLSSRSYPLAWELGSVTIQGTLQWGWHAPESLIQIPEEPCFDFLSLVLRDRVLILEHAGNPSAEPTIQP